MLYFILFAVFSINLIFVLSQSYIISAGITSNPATSRSIYEIVRLLIRILYVLHFPLLVSLIETKAIHEAEKSTSFTFSLILYASSLGAVVGLFYFDFSEKIISKLVNEIYQEKNKVKFFKRIFTNLYRLPKLVYAYHIYSSVKIKIPSLQQIPVKFGLISILSMTFLFVGNYACLYAGILYPDFRMTAMSLTGIINGVATLSAVLFVDIKLSLYVDLVNNKELPIKLLRILVYVYVVSIFIGSLLAQFLLEPGARFIVLILKLIV